MALLAHPFCTAQVAQYDLLHAGWLARGVDFENDPSHFVGAGAVGAGVEQAEVHDVVGFVVFGERTLEPNFSTKSEHAAYGAHARAADASLERSITFLTVDAYHRAPRAVGIRRALS
jgi:hypothetical protein